MAVMQESLEIVRAKAQQQAEALLQVQADASETPIEARKQIGKSVFGFVGFALVFTTFIALPILAGFAAIPWSNQKYELRNILGPTLWAVGFFPAITIGFLAGTRDALGWEVVKPVRAGAFVLVLLNAAANLVPPLYLGVEMDGSFITPVIIAAFGLAMMIYLYGAVAWSVR